MSTQFAKLASGEGIEVSVTKWSEMDEFRGKDEHFVAEWLKREGFKPEVVQAFVGKL